MTGESRRYLAYLLRLWQVAGTDGGPVWRASLEDVHTGARLGFGSLEQILAFLVDTTAGPPPSTLDPETPLT